MKIWIDADATPRAVRDVLIKASTKRVIPMTMVANRSQQMPKTKWITLVVVPGGFDEADDYIADHCQAGDLVITQDIPLAARVVEVGAVAITPRGSQLDEETVRSRLSMRDFKEDLRASGVMTGGPPPFGPKDKQKFAAALDRLLTKMHKPR